MKTRKLALQWHLIAVFCFFFLSICACASLPTPPEQPIHDTLIVPGKRIGPVSLGMTASQLFQTMGSPISSFQYDDGRSDNTFSGEIIATVHNNNKVCKVRTYSSRYATEKGLKVGSSALEVRAVMGSPRIVNDVETCFWYKYSGIDFNFYNRPQDNKVTFIDVEL